MGQDSRESKLKTSPDPSFEFTRYSDLEFQSRPIRITMESPQRKEVFMSSLWKLKHGPEKFQKISVTDDYTQDERREMGEWGKTENEG